MVSTWTLLRPDHFPVSNTPTMPLLSTWAVATHARSSTLARHSYHHPCCRLAADTPRSVYGPTALGRGTTGSIKRCRQETRSETMCICIYLFVFFFKKKKTPCDDSSRESNVVEDAIHDGPYQSERGHPVCGSSSKVRLKSNHSENSKHEDRRLVIADEATEDKIKGNTAASAQWTSARVARDSKGHQGAILWSRRMLEDLITSPNGPGGSKGANV